MRKVLVMMVAAVLLAGVAHAQTASFASSSQAPVAIDASQGLEWDRKAQTYTARGNVVAKQENTTLYTDLLTANYRENAQGSNQIYQLNGTGNVVIVNQNAKDGKTQTVRGDQAIYNVDEGVFRVTGSNLRLETGVETITARDALEYWRDQQVAYARGNAVVVREDNHLAAQELKANFVEEGGQQDGLQIKEIFAQGDVVITTPDEVARGNAAHYNAQSGVATLKGEVSITRGENQLRGDLAEVNLKTGISRLLSQQEGGRVHGLFSKTKE